MSEALKATVEMLGGRGTAVAAAPVLRDAAKQDAAGGIFLLCTPWPDFVHGQVLTVAGGQAEGMS